MSSLISCQCVHHDSVRQLGELIRVRARCGDQFPASGFFTVSSLGREQGLLHSLPQKKLDDEHVCVVCVNGKGDESGAIKEVCVCVCVSRRR